MIRRKSQDNRVLINGLFTLFLPDGKNKCPDRKQNILLSESEKKSQGERPLLLDSDSDCACE